MALAAALGRPDHETEVAGVAQVDPERPVLVDKYLEEAGEIDVDALCDCEGNVVIGGIMEHIEQAGVHSGDSACTLPAQTVPKDSLETIRRWTPQVPPPSLPVCSSCPALRGKAPVAERRRLVAAPPPASQLAKKLGVVGLLNIQYAVRKNGDVYILEANPRASRTVPFVAKAVGHPLAAYATLLMAGKTLKEVGLLVRHPLAWPIVDGYILAHPGAQDVSGTLSLPAPPGLAFSGVGG